MLILSILADPRRADLTQARLDALCRELAGDAPRWLAPGIAAECTLAGAPAQFDALRERERRAGFDLALTGARDRRKRVLVADMDSTMIGQECIDELAAAAGVGAQVAAITARAMNGEIDFEAALVERVQRLAGLPVAAIDHVLEKRITLAAGGRALVATMRAHGARAVLVSGGFTAFTGPVARRLGFDAHHGNRLLVADGRLTGEVARPILGRDAKLQQLHRIAAEAGVDVGAAAAVGDGANDLPMLQAAGLGVALHAKPAVAAAAPVSLHHADLTGLLYLQGYRADEITGAGPP